MHRVWGSGASPVGRGTGRRGAWRAVGVHEHPGGCRYDGQVVLDDNGLWRSLVAHLTGGQGVAGSNPVSPTERSRKLKGFRDF